MCRSLKSSPCPHCTGQLVWRRHMGFALPSHYAICATCTQLLPLLEMYCKWELQEDCTDLWALMVRFDSEAELESHELGRSLLFMVRDDADQMDILPARLPPMPTASPFDEVRERLSAAGHAIRNMHEQVQLQPSFCTTYVYIHIQSGSFEHVILFLRRLKNKKRARGLLSVQFIP